MQLEHFCLQTSALNALAVDTDGTDKEVSKVLGDVSQAGTGTQPELPSALLVSPTERAPTVPPTSLPSKVDSNERETSKSKECYTGKVRLCTARYSYNPYDGPNEHPEAELPLVAGKYLYVYGDMDDDGFYQGELPDGQRGLVPSNFVEFVQDKETVLVSEADDVQEDNFTDLAEDTGPQPTGRDGEAEQVPHPRRITLIKQLARSVIVGWEPAPGSISGYEVLVDGEVRCHVSAGSQNKALIEKLDLEGRAYRLSVRSLVEAAVSDEMCCCLLVGRGVVVAPGRLRVDNITSTSAELSWSPSNSNYTHRVLLDGIESVVLGPARYRCSLVGLQPARMYRVRVEARPHRVPWQLPLEQRERKEVSLEFCTQAAGPPLPPQQVQVHCEKASGLLQVSWTPPPLSVTGTSNGASVTGYAVCTKGQRIAEVMFASADFTMVDLRQIQHLDAGEVVVRTLSTQGESQDSAVVNIPTDAMEAPPRPLQSANLPYSQPHSQETGVCSLPWDQPFCPCPPLPPPFNPSLEPVPLRRSPSPQRILPQPRGEPIPHTVAQAIARQAAQRISCSGHGQSLEENEDEDGVCRPPRVRKGTSMDEFLRGSELGRQLMRSHSEENQTESSRGSDLSDIMEEEEDEEDEDLYSEIEMGKASSRPALDPMKTSVTLPKSKHLGQLGQDSSQRPTQRRSPAHQRARTVPAIEITTEANSAEETHNRQIRDESHTQTVSRVFVALFDYDPLSMSPNPDAADEELSFREGQILRVYGEKDADGFYHGQLEGRLGLVPCNMVSEIQVKDDERAEQLLHQGFLSLSTPVKHIERSTRPTPTPHVCRMVALYDYDPRESSPNVDVEAELTFSAGDIITIMGEIDEDGFYCGEVNGHRGLVPSNFLEEVPDDVEVYLTEGQNTQTRTVPSEPSPTHTPQDFSSKRKKGLLSKGKSLLKKLAVVK